MGLLIASLVLLSSPLGASHYVMSITNETVLIPWRLPHCAAIELGYWMLFIIHAASSLESRTIR